MALSCAERGAKVIMACRNAEKAEKARRQIIEKSGNSNVHFRLLDVSSFKSVREFSKRCTKLLIIKISLINYVNSIEY